MKILIVTGIFPPDHGGPASYVPTIARGLQECGNEIISVVTLSEKNNFDDSKYSFPVVRIPRSRFRILRWAQTIYIIANLARKADIIYLNGLVCEGVLAGKFLSRRPVVIKVVGDLIWEKARNACVTNFEIDDFQSEWLPIRWRILRRLQSWYMSMADTVITPSRYLAGIIKGWGVPDKNINVIYNAVSVPSDSCVSSIWSYDIVSVGRLVSWKGMEALIQVCAKLKRRLCIVGDGPLRSKLENMASELKADVTFAGHVDHADVFTILRKAPIFILNSTYEGLPHVVLEAKAASVAVIATSVGGTPETITDGVDGLLIPPKNFAAMESAILKLTNSPDYREQIAVAGSKQIASKFSSKMMILKTLEILKSVV